MSELVPATRASESAPVGVRRQLGARVRLLDAPVTALALIVGLSTALRAALSLGVASVWILPDEVVYSELAKSIAEGNRPAVRGVPAFGWGEIYPTLIAPAWAFFDDPYWAYHASLVLNALIMSSAAVPAYLLARYFVSRRSSLLVALMTVVVPSMSYTDVVMTENAAYPAFILALLLITRAVVSPTVMNQGLALAGLGLVFFTRIQGAALGGAYLLAIAAYAFVRPPSERLAYLRRFALTAVSIIAPPLVVIAISIARGDGASGWLGSKSDTFEGFHLNEVPEWFAFLTADLVLYTAVVPLAATAIVIGRGVARGHERRARLFAVIAVPTFLAIVGSISIVSASLDVDGTENLNERYVFYVVPLAFIAMALWIELGLPRPRPGAGAVAVACCALAVALPIDRLAYNASFQSVAFVPWLVLPLEGISLRLVVGAFTVACGVLWLATRAEQVGRLVLLTAGVMVLTGTLASASHGVSASNSASAFHGVPANWIDRAVPADSEVAVVWREAPEQDPAPRQLYFWIMVSEFFNTHVGPVYRLGEDTYYERFLPTVPVELAAGRRLIDGLGRRVDAPYVLVPCQTRIVGRRVATGPGGFLELIEVDPPLRLAPKHSCVRPSW